MDDYLKANKDRWDKLTSVHANSKYYDIEGFKNGKSNLMPLEIKEVGDVKDKTLLHLQCHFGMGTLSWVREGAIATGVDLSEESINLAKQLSKDINAPANFICSDIYDLPNVLNEKFDVVFTSYGVLCWLPDLKKWAKVISHFLKPGGIFYIVEDHPFMNIFDENFKINPSYFSKEPNIQESTGSYADRKSGVKTKSYQWSHPVSEIINSLVDEGL